ncbi:MAG: histidine phosphatase family protein [Chloroflexi bacterium]|nr:histidine phosphatase family protein [Chloroflexota bacterium]MBI3040443.1 histidine phosphatase family protein [Chloroflexota bacterium]
MARLLLVRHGITEFNSSRRFAGHSDVELSAEGYRQVERLRDRLTNEKIDAVYSSDLRRALVTAEVISPEHKTDIVVCSELREINYGDAEGLTFEEIGHHHPELAESITNFSLELSFPGGESFKGFIARTCQFLDRLNEHAQEQTILIVSHGGALRTLVCDLLGIDQSHWRKFRFDNASLSIIDTYPKRAILSLLNDTSHLRDTA